MNKKKLHHIWTKIRPISYWYFLVAFVVSLTVSVYALRQNNLNMIKLRDAVSQTDQQNGNVEVALKNLREYVYAHMNTALASGPNAIKPPLQLKYTYDRLVKAEQDRVAAVNANVYNDAQNSCEAQFPGSFSGGPRVPCISAYVASHGAKEQPTPDALYKFDFVSPTWTPDLAGWSLLASIVLLFLFLLRFGLEKWAKAVLQPHD
jgi:hypothetical protein